VEQPTELPTGEVPIYQPGECLEPNEYEWFLENKERCNKKKYFRWLDSDCRLVSKLEKLEEKKQRISCDELVKERINQQIENQLNVEKAAAAEKLVRVYKKNPKAKLVLLKSICGDVGICLSLNARYERIMEMFNHFEDFKYLDSSPKIISQGGNGIVRLLKYKRTEGKQTFYSYGIFKFPLPAVTRIPDNLLYEYEVGTRCVNYLCRYFPIFTQTYGAYLSLSPSILYQYILPGLKDKNVFDDTSLTKITPTDQRYQKHFCEDIGSLCLVSQFYHEFKTLDSYAEYMNDEQQKNNTAPNDIAFILFQVYYALHECRTHFTHYDLHPENIGIVPLPNNKHIVYEYTYTPVLGGQPQVCSFKSRYIVKLIDYGRSFFNYNGVSSDDIIQRALNSSFCPPMQSNFGIANFPQYHLNPRVNNQSYDLRLLVLLLLSHVIHPAKRLLNNFPSLLKLTTRVLYQYYINGTPERLDAFDPNPDARIYNVSDAFFKLTQYIKDNVDGVNTRNTTDYANSTSIGTLRVYPNLAREMEFSFATRNKTTEPSRLSMPEFENVDL
jgi:hypothetical protein